MYFTWVIRDFGTAEWFHSLLHAIEEQDTQNRIEINIYLTAKIKEDDMTNIIVQDVGAEKDAITSLRAPTHFGRPNWDRVFSSIAEKHPETDVGVVRFLLSSRDVRCANPRCSSSVAPRSSRARCTPCRTSTRPPEAPGSSSERVRARLISSSPPPLIVFNRKLLIVLDITGSVHHAASAAGVFSVADGACLLALFLIYESLSLSLSRFLHVRLRVDICKDSSGIPWEMVNCVGRYVSACLRAARSLAARCRRVDVDKYKSLNLLR